MKLLVIGSGGMLGHMVTLYLTEKGYDVVDISKSKKCRDQSLLLDVLDWDSFEKFLDGNQFDYIINCAALLVKESLVKKDIAIELNALLPHRLEKKYAESNTKIIQISTAGVYGDGQPPFDENAAHATRIFYGRTKSLGELDNNKDFTVRSDFIGPDIKENGVGLINWGLTQHGKIFGYSKAIINGVTSLEFAKFIEVIVKNDYTGVYNMACENAFSKAQILELMCKKLGKTDLQIELNDSVKSNASVCSNRNDIDYQQKSYEQQFTELVDWINNHRGLYKHYFV